MPPYRIGDYLGLVQEVCHYGSGAAQVPDRLRRMAADLVSVARPEHIAAVREWAECVP